MTKSDEVARMLSPANVRQALDIRAYAESLFMGAANRPKACPDCLQADGGYRDTELCGICYSDRYSSDDRCDGEGSDL